MGKNTKIFGGKRYKLYRGSKFSPYDFSVKSDAKEVVTNLRKKCYNARMVKSPFGWWVYTRKKKSCR